jgi:integrase
MYRITWPIRGQRPGSDYVAGSRIDAERELRARLNERDAGAGKVDRRMTVGRWVDAWLAGPVAGKATGTRIRYADISARLIVPALGRIRLAELTSSDVERFRADLVRAGYTKRGADSILDVLGAALGAATKVRPHPLIAQNVRAGVDREPKARRLIDPPTRPEQDAILAAVADDATWSAIYALTIGHGLRSSELLGLRHGDRIGDRLTIQRKREYRTGDTSEEPKDGSVRRLTLAPWVAAALDRLPKATPAAPLFPGGRPGTTVHPHTLLDHIHRLSGELGLRRRYTWHDLRRAYGTRIAATNSPAAVTAAMGHRDYRTSLLYIAPVDVVDDWTPAVAAPLLRH